MENYLFKHSRSQLRSSGECKRSDYNFFSLLNKGQTFKYNDGRTFNYKLGNAWILFYSPDYSANNSSAGGGYQVLTNPGQAYRYSWDISSITAGKEQTNITIKTWVRLIQ